MYTSAGMQETHTLNMLDVGQWRRGWSTIEPFSRETHPHTADANTAGCGSYQHSGWNEAADI